VKALFDTSVLVAALVAKHPHHPRAMAAVRRVLTDDETGCVSAHGLAETYAVLTSLPVTPRIGPESAHRMVADNVLAHFDLVALTAREYVAVVASAAEQGTIGGATYDAIHAACARKARVDRLYTFNTPHFRRVAPDLAHHVVAP
jgi:predicted nucleic acid-binding protein